MPSLIPNTSPFDSSVPQATQVKQVKWYTSSRARMTSSLAVMPFPQRAQRFTQNNLQQQRYELFIYYYLFILVT